MLVWLNGLGKSMEGSYLVALAFGYWVKLVTLVVLQHEKMLWETRRSMGIWSVSRLLQHQ